MGGITSTYQNNSELVDHLVTSRSIVSETVENIFRAVDRGDFLPRGERRNAYRNSAWTSENIHISSPCVYGQVVEHLNFSPGLSFLNLGSGTGYLNTLVGLLLGPNGINHGIDINEYVVQYAKEKVDEFEKNSTALDEFEFCKPKFIIGNCFCLGSDFPQYDRVYCGSACPKQYENYIKKLIKVKGILIMVVDGVLSSYTRTTEDTWIVKNLRSIYFTFLVSPGSEKVEPFKTEPKSLQDLSRLTIRNALRRNIEKDFAEEIENARTDEHENERKKRRVLAPLGEGSYDLLRHEIEFTPTHLSNPVWNGNRLISARSTEANNETTFRWRRISTYYFNFEPDVITAESDPDVGSAPSVTDANLYRMHNDESEEVNVTDVDEPTTASDEQIDVDEPTLDNLEILPDTNSDSESTTDDSGMNIEELAPLVQSLTRFGELYVTNDSEIESISEEQQEDAVYVNPYTLYMRARIQALPLPKKLKRYLNYNKDLD